MCYRECRVKGCEVWCAIGHLEIKQRAIIQPASQPTNQPISQPVNQLINQLPTRPSTHQPTHPTNQPTNIQNTGATSGEMASTSDFPASVGPSCCSAGSSISLGLTFRALVLGIVSGFFFFFVARRGGLSPGTPVFLNSLTGICFHNGMKLEQMLFQT